MANVDSSPAKSGEPEPGKRKRPREFLSRIMFMTPQQRKAEDPDLYRIEEEFGPFIHANSGPAWRLWSVVSCVAGIIFLVPIRLIILGIALFAFQPIYWVILLGYPKGVPLKGLRRRLFQAVSRADNRMVLFALGFWTIDVVRLDPSPQETHPFAPLISNHTTFLDIPVLIVAERAVGFVAKSPVRDYPIIGSVAKGIDTIFVERGSSNSRTEVSDEVIARASGKHRCPDGAPLPVTIFPEGATTNGNQLITFRPGVFRTGKPVRPVIIKYYTNNWSASWESIRVPRYLLHMMTSIRNRCCIQELPVYEPSPAEIANPELYAENVRCYMAHAGGFPLSPYSVNDKLAFLSYLNHCSSVDEAFESAEFAHQRDAQYAANLAELRARCEAKEPHSSYPLLLPEEFANCYPHPFPGNHPPPLTRRPLPASVQYQFIISDCCATQSANSTDSQEPVQ